MKTRANDSAYPEIITDLDRQNPTHPGDTYSHGGMTKREVFASAAASGLLAGLAHGYNSIEIADQAVEMADRLIHALNLPESGT